MSATSTALPRIRAATAIEIEEVGEIPVPFNINTRTNATICKATKKKIVGGNSSNSSFLSVVDSLLIELNCDESYRFHGSCSFRGLFCLGLKIPFLEFLRCCAEWTELVNGRARRREGERLKRFGQHLVEILLQSDAGADVRVEILAGLLRDKRPDILDDCRVESGIIVRRGERPNGTGFHRKWLHGGNDVGL